MDLDVETLEVSFDLVAGRGEALMDEFYGRLFATAPGVRQLFPRDTRQQKTMLLGALVLLRESLRDLDAILPRLRSLGARSHENGVRPEYYPIACAALIESMAAIAGGAWRPEHERAWSVALEVVTATMLEAVAQAELEATA